ncbi:MAG: hypothetical protein M0Q91_18225 [Methanoregula sp.]|jgi:hypothetical protein|nr:hypothetical protein [Methanoregula sp.]
MSPAVIGIKSLKPERSDNHYLINEVIADLGISNDQILKLNRIVDKLYHEIGGDVPKLMRAIPGETSDPVEIAFLNYALAYDLVEHSFMEAIPVLVKEAINTGAQIAMQEIQRGSPEAMPESPSPIMAPGNEPERMYG